MTERWPSRLKLKLKNGTSNFEFWIFYLNFWIQILIFCDPTRKTNQVSFFSFIIIWISHNPRQNTKCRHAPIRFYSRRFHLNWHSTYSFGMMASITSRLFSGEICAAGSFSSSWTTVHAPNSFAFAVRSSYLNTLCMPCFSSITLPIHLFPKTVARGMLR